MRLRRGSMQMLKRMGPRTAPWRTPWVVMRSGEEWFPMDINVVRPVIKDISHAMPCP